MKSLARFCVRRRWMVLGAWIALFVGINIASFSIGSDYSNTFSFPGTNSVHALQLLQSNFKSNSGDVDHIVFDVTSGTLSSHEHSINAMLAKVSKLPEVAVVASPFTDALQMSKNGKIAYATVNFFKQAQYLKKSDVQAVVNEAETLRSSSLQVNFGGGAFGNLTAPTGSPDEGIGLIATAVVLFLAFGSLFAMLLPLGVALFAIGIATGATTLLSHGLSIAQFAPILGSLIGLGVGIDYALFIVTRSRQNLKQGMSVEDSIITAIDTSGRAVLFAGATVCVALLGMLILGFSFLVGLGVAAALTVFITMMASLTLLPALLAFQKMRVLSRRNGASSPAPGPKQQPSREDGNVGPTSSDVAHARSRRLRFWPLPY
jgi:RND superfamily putative drug exporter